ncbi:MAG: PKD domain-containing protein, partial [Bacteroidota bacterium]
KARMLAVLANSPRRGSLINSTTCSNPGGGNSAPIAVASANPTAGTAPLIVSFDASGSSDPDNDPLTYSWDFGDGNTGSGLSPSHTYNAAGNFTAVLTISDGSLNDDASIAISVSNPGGGCTENVINSEDFESGPGIWIDGGDDARRLDNASYASSGNFSFELRDNTATSVMTTGDLDLSTAQTLKVDFTYFIRSMENNEDFWLQISTDGGTTFTTVEDWVAGTDFSNGDRTTESVLINGPFSANTQVRFRNDASGNFDFVYIDDVSLTACTSGGGGGNQAPTAAFTATPISGTVPLNVNFDASASSDPDADPLTYSWDFGDGTSGSGVNVSHVYTSTGSYAATLTVSDGTLSDMTTVSITVNPAGGCTQTTIDSEDFEANLGIWNDGGADCSRRNDPAYANSGNFSVRLRDDTNTSVMTTDDLDLSSFTELTVDFSYYVFSFEGVEDFWLQISTDGGASFTLIEEWNLGDEFNNDERKFDQVVIPGPFTANTQVRFRADASGNQDWVFIDDVMLSGCTSNPGAAVVSQRNNLPSIEPRDPIVRAYPNPIDPNLQALQIDLQLSQAEKLHLQLISLQGQVVQQQSLQMQHASETLSLSLPDLAAGVYILRVQGNEWAKNLRVMIR